MVMANGAGTEKFLLSNGGKGVGGGIDGAFFGY
jgi:hypothetical protein